MNNEPKKPGSSYDSRPLPVDNDHSIKDLSLEQTHQRTVTALDAEKKRHRSRPILVILLALLIAALGGVATLAVYKYFYETTPRQSTETKASNSEQSTLLTAKDVITAVNKRMTGVKVDSVFHTVPSVKLAGDNFYVKPPADGIRATIRQVDASQADVEVANIRKVLIGLNFTERILNEGDDTLSMIKDYSHSDVMCQVRDTPTVNNQNGRHVISVSCADMAQYTTTSVGLRPLAIAYQQSRPLQGEAQLAEPRISDSQTEGYRLGTFIVAPYLPDGAGSGAGTVWLYRSPNSPWRYLTSTGDTGPNMPDCENISTEESRKAFIGQPCYDQVTNSERTI